MKLNFNRLYFNLEITARSIVSRYRNAHDHSLKIDQPLDIYLCVVDHYEPSVGNAPRNTAKKRHEEWLNIYPKIAETFQDFDGHNAVHTFFYPWDEYNEWEFQSLSEMCRNGAGEIELHLHHANDNETTLRHKLSEAIQTYYDNGAFSKRTDGSIAFGFIHGNWALDNSRLENGVNYCGVNNEITILNELGCYADFTFPAWRHTAQPRVTNAIYYAKDNPHLPKSYDTGSYAEIGKNHAESDLLMIQGPLYPYINKSFRLVMDDSNLAASHRYHINRFHRWIKSKIHVMGKPDSIFIKLHCHGACEKDRQVLLQEDLPALYNDAIKYFNDGKIYRMHFVTARQLYNIIKYTEKDESHLLIKNPREWLISSPQKRKITANVISQKT